MQPDPISGFVVPEDSNAATASSHTRGRRAAQAPTLEAQPTATLLSGPSALTPTSPLRSVVSGVEGTSVAGEFEQAFANLVGARNFESLLKSRIECTYQGGRLRVEAAHPFVLQLLQSRFRAPLRQAAEAVGCEPPEPRLSPKPTPAAPGTNANAATGTGTATEPVTGTGSSTAGGDVSALANPLSHSEASPAGPAARHTSAAPMVGAGNRTATSPVSDRGAAGSSSHAAGTQASGPLAVPRRLGRLEDFVAGPHAAAALAATKAFTHSGPAGHALYLFGGTGTGKTHLLEGIVTELRRHPGGPQPLLVTAEQFTNLFTTALRSHELPSFRAKLRGVDVLLVDDVDFLDGKPRVQEEFLHTLQQLESTGRRFVLAADRHPRLLSRTRPELQTRFLSGVLCRVEQPDRDTREQIVVRKAGLLALRLVPESARLLAASSCTSVRDLEGLLHTLRNLHRIPDQPVPPGLVRQVVAEIERDCVRVVRLPDIERVICETFGVSVEDLRSERRTRTVAEPRMLAMYLARRHTRAAYAEIGAYFGGRNHATVMSAEKRMQQAVADNARVQVAISQWGVADLVQALEQRLLAG